MAKGGVVMVAPRRHSGKWGQSHSHSSTVPIPFVHSDNRKVAASGPSLSAHPALVLPLFPEAFPLGEGGQS